MIFISNKYLKYNSKYTNEFNHYFKKYKNR